MSDQPMETFTFQGYYDVPSTADEYIQQVTLRTTWGAHGNAEEIIAYAWKVGIRVEGLQTLGGWYAKTWLFTVRGSKEQLDRFECIVRGAATS